VSRPDSEVPQPHARPDRRAAPSRAMTPPRPMSRLAAGPPTARP